MKKFLSLFFAFAWTMIAFAATETTVYFSAPEKWIGENTVKLNVELQKNVENGWSQMEMTKSTLTYNGNPVYIGTYTDVEDGVYTMQFQLWDAEDKWKGQDEVYNSAESLTPVAEYNGKMYVHGTGWTAAPTENGGDNPGQGEGGEQTEVTYTLVGSPTIFGSSWDTEDIGNDMVKGEDGNYTLTKENVHLSNPTYEYKMVVNHKWGAGQIPADNSNQSITIETAGIYNVTFTLDMKDYVLTAVPQLITADAGGQTETVYTMVGDADIFGSSWTITDTNNDMVKGADGNYTLEKANVHLNAQQYEYKMVVNHDWGAGQIPENNSNLSFTVNTAGTYNVTFTLDMKDYALAADVQLVKADEQEQPQTFTGYIQPGVWDVDGAKFAAWVWKKGEEGQWTAFADAIDGAEVSTYAIDVPAHIDSLIFVRFKPETETPSWDWDDETQSLVWVWNQTGHYGTPKAENCRTFVITDWDKGLWCGQEEEEEEETSEFHVYLQGSWNNWEGLHEFTLNEDTTQATLTMERLGMSTYEYQIVVTSGKDEYHFANTGTMTRNNCTGWDFATDLGYGINAGLEADMDGAYTFNLVIDKAALAINVSVTYPDNGQGGEQTETIYTLAGSKDLLGSEWNVEDQANDMTATEENGIYTLTKENIHLNAGTHTFRVYADRDFKGYQVPADHDQELVIKQAGTYNVTFTLNTNEHTLDVVPELVKADEQEQPQTFTGYIQPGIWDEAGAKFAAWVWKKGEEGQWTAFADAIDGTEVSTYAIDVPAHIDSLIFVRFKPETETPSWDWDDETQSLVWVWNQTGHYGTPKAENCRTFVITDWDKGLWCGQEEEQEEETSEFHVYLQGSWNNWEGLHECTLNEDTTAATLTMDHLGAGTYEYQIVVTVGKDEYHFANKGTMTRDNCTGWDFATDLGYGVNAGLEADMDGAYTFNLVIDKVARTVKVSVTYPDNGQGGEQTETIYTLAGSKDLFGTEWDLTNEANDMVATAEANIYSLTKENVHLNAGTHTFRVYADRDFKGYQVPADHDQELVIKQAGTYNVTFTLNTNEHTLDVVPELVKADEQEQPQTFTGYIQPGMWDVDGAKFAAWVWKNGEEGQWTAFADAIDGTEVSTYAIDVPAHIDSLIFVRFKPETETPSWETEIVGESEQYVWIWNRTGSYGTPKAENCRTFVITDWDKGLWCGQEEEQEEETSEFHVYLQGSWNNWEGLHECTLNEDTTAATLTMDHLGAGTYEYQIVVTVGKDEYHFANKGTMTRDNCTGWDFATDLGYGVNAGLEADMDGAYTFNLVIDKAALAFNVSVTYPDNGQEEQTTTVYFVNTENWETVYIYAWTGEGETFEENAPWPGIEMGKLRPLVNGHDVYAYDLDNKFSNIIFNGASDDKKTGNLTLSANAPYFYGSTWYAEIDDIPAEQQPELHVYLQGSWDNWAELHEFTLNMETFTATLDLQLEAETYDFQIVVNLGEEIRFYDPGTMTRDNCTGWNFVVAGYEQNAKIAADMNGTYTFTIAGNMATGQVSLSVTYPDNQGSALEETTVSSELRKVMENGVLYIIRDGKMYNAQGAVVY